MTVSGVNRGDQREIYDARRRRVLAEHEIELVELPYFEFLHNNDGTLQKIPLEDKKILKEKLKIWI